MDFSGIMSELQGVRKLMSGFVIAFYLPIVLILTSIMRINSSPVFGSRVMIDV